MPSKKKKYNARFPAGRIKKIMQSDEEVGKVAQAVPIIISRTLELFVESLLTKTLKITNSRNARTLSTSHMKQCIMSEQRFDFLRELVRNIPDISIAEEAANYNEEDNQSSPEEQYPDSDTPYDLSMPSTSLKATRQHQVASNGHNGGNSSIPQHHYDYQRNHLKRSISSNSSSVIRHTTSMAQPNVDCIPAKLLRSDTTPVPSQLSSLSSLTTSLVQHPRLKHQSYSMPSNTDNYKPNINTSPKQLRSPSQQTVIPAPILSIDYCSKPVVKIDYSNLPIVEDESAPNAVDTPLSAPANIASMSNNNTAFNFTAEPVINIDLSNIVASSATSVAPNMATISIGTPTLATSSTSPLSPTSLSSSPVNKTKPTLSNAVEKQSRNSKAVMAEPFNSSTTGKAPAIAAKTTTTIISTASNNDSYLEMDEDYDNI